MTSEQKEFINNIYNALKKYAPSYDICCYPVIIAQAIVESTWGKSKLSSKYHNYFGLKCGSSWKGRRVNLTTQEEYTEGTMTTIKDYFRVYSSLEEGVKGYLDFINTKRYANLKGVSNCNEYAVMLKADGYATDYNYVKNLMNVIDKCNLMNYSITKDDRPYYQIGNTYELLSNMNVRKNASINAVKVQYSEMSTDAKKHCRGKEPILLRGTKVTCKGVITENGNTWIKIPSGYVAGYYNGKQYIK